MSLRLPLDDLSAGDRDLPPEAARYVTRVHRLGAGDRFQAFDPEHALVADGAILSAARDACRVRIENITPAPRPSREVTLIQAIGKGDKLDAIVRDATELGATRVVPVIAIRSVSRPGEARSERWRRIAVEAARQCGRGDAPLVEPPASLLKVLQSPAAPETLALCLDPTASQALGPLLTATLGNANAVTLVVGPEGGLDPEELQAAERAGYTRVNLGPRVLRTETVCAAVLGALVVLSTPQP
jgi:16S rRNA (uracil1498-N3)-methyltransferase